MRYRTDTELLPQYDAAPMKYLVFCTCGHSMERHAVAGCESADVQPWFPCGCKKDQMQALDSAIDDARKHPWGRPEHMEAVRTPSAVS